MADLVKNNPILDQLTEPVASENARYIAMTRYAMKGEDGKAVEDMKGLYWRVAYNIALGDKKFQETINQETNKIQSPITNDQTEKKTIEQAKMFYDLMASQKFFPNTPCLVNAGKEHQQLSACFVLPVDDSMEAILATMHDMAMIHKSGGGTGFSFSRLRPYGDYISTSGGTTVGPVSFMQAYNDVTAQIKQGGVRRGANMGMLSVEHPDVLRFAVVKLDEYSLTNFNISLAVTNKFMDRIEPDKKFVSDDSIPEEIVEQIRAAEGNRDADARLRDVEKLTEKLYDWARATDPNEGYELINPRNGKVVDRLNAFKVFNLVTRLAWQYGDPGLVFIDRMNEPSSNPVPAMGMIEATNPCGEQPLLPYDACNLGSINVSRFVIARPQAVAIPNGIASSPKIGQASRNDVLVKNDFDIVGDASGINGIASSQNEEAPRNDVLDWAELRRVVHEAVHFLDNVVEVNVFPVQKIREMVSKTRRIGLGVMGFADMLFKIGVRYDSEQGVEWAKKIMKFINDEARIATTELAKDRGVFPAWEISVFAGTNYRPRNMALTTIAPTGTISYIADTTSGIEPAFSLGYQKNNVEGNSMFMMNQTFVDELKRRDLYSEQLLDQIVKNGGKLTGIDGLPDDLVNTFRTAMEIEPEWHVRIQGAFQEFTDNAVSKTINFPKEATVEDVRTAYRLAWTLGTKGITIYRTGSREKEVIQTVKEKSAEAKTNGVASNPPLAGSRNDVSMKKKTPEAARGVRLRKSCDVGKVYTSVFFEEGDGPVEVFVNLGKSGGYMAGASEVTGRLASLSLKYGASLDEVAAELVGISCGSKVGMGPNAILSMFDAVGKSLLEVAKGEQLDMFSAALAEENATSAKDEKEKLELGNGKSEKTKEEIKMGGNGRDHSLQSNGISEKLPESNVRAQSIAPILSEIRAKHAEGESKFNSCPDCGSPLYAEEGCFKCSNSFCGYSKCS